MITSEEQGSSLPIGETQTPDTERIPWEGRPRHKLAIREWGSSWETMVRFKIQVRKFIEIYNILLW